MAPSRVIDLKQVGIRIRSRCKALSILFCDLGQSLTPPANSTSLQRYLNGKALPNPNRLVQIAERLGTTTEWILYGEDPNITDKDVEWLRFLQSPKGNELVSTGFQELIHSVTKQLIPIPSMDHYRKIATIWLNHRSQQHASSLSDSRHK